MPKVTVCDKCEGRGGKKGCIMTCQTCHGTGKEIRMRQVFPGMVQQVEQICRQCSGQGETIAAKDRCKQCNGKRTIRDRKVVEVHIEKGMPDGHQICFEGEGNQESVDVEPGDIVVTISQTRHSVFERQKNDLVINLPIMLTDALCGFRKIIKTLDNRDLLITQLPGQVIKTKDVKYVRGEGMPIPDKERMGQLVIHFCVIFPAHIDVDLIPKLEACLPPRPKIDIPMDEDSLEEYILVRSCLIIGLVFILD